MSILSSIITVNYNGIEDTCALIDTITFNNTMEVIVVDNGSKNDEASVIEAKYPQVKVLRSNKNLGFAGGNNLGIKAATGRYLYFINNDTVFKPYQIQSMINRLDSDNTIGIVCPKIRFAWDNNPIQFAGYTPLSRLTVRNKAIGFGETDRGQYATPHETPYAHGAAMMVRREAIDKAGMMPECYFLYYEELDWSMMIRRAGYTIWYDPSSTIYHKESKSTGQNSPLRTYYITRNRLLFVKRNETSNIKYFSYIYLICIVAFKDIIKYSIKGRTDLAKAVCKGVFHFLKMS